MLWNDQRPCLFQVNDLIEDNNEISRLFYIFLKTTHLEFHHTDMERIIYFQLMTNRPLI